MVLKKINRVKANKNITYIKYICAGLITGFANGLFGSGGGTIIVPVMTHFLDVEEHKSHATAIAIILPLTVLSTIIYVANKRTDWPLTLKVIIGGVVGGYIGAKMLKAISAASLRKVFGLFLIFAALRMLAG